MATPLKEAGPLLMVITEDGYVKMALPPKYREDDYPARASVLGKLDNASHVICSPEGELFCVRGGDLYRGPMPSKEGIDWFSTARRVGKGEWSKFKNLCFHFSGELYGATYNGDFYRGPQPDNENVPWIQGQATQIGAGGWQYFGALFFDPCGDLYAVTKDDKFVKGPPPTPEHQRWLDSSTVVGGYGWLELTHFMAFTPDGKLWTVHKSNGNIYRGCLPTQGSYKDNAENLGWNYHIFPFLSFTKDKTISKILSLDFLTKKGKTISKNPEVIHEEIFDNRKSSIILKHTFKIEKSVKHSSSFSHEHGFTFEVGARIGFEAGVPCVAQGKTEVEIKLGTTHTWCLSDTNETQETFSSSADAEVPPGKAIQMVASVTKANLSVPYKARVVTLFGFETEVEGTWTGVSVYNLMVKQEDYNQ